MKRIATWALGAFTASIGMSAEAHAQSMPEALRELAPSSVISQLRIVGGQVTSQSEWPWQTALYFRVGDGRELFLCGGSLIAPLWVLSAAHCFGAETSSDPGDWAVATGIAELSFEGLAKGAVTRKVKRVVVHEHYNPNTQENDIALLELAEPIPGSTITLQLTPDRALEADREATVTGWGLTRWIEPRKDEQGHVVGFIDGETKQPVDPKEFLSPYLHKAEIPLIDFAQCARDYSSERSAIDGRNLCAGLAQGGRDSCQGDSGGPMVVQTGLGEWRQIGVVSWGKGCGLARYPGIYTRVSAFGDWIRGVVGRDLVVASQSPSAPAPAQPQPSDPAQQPTSSSPPTSSGPALDNSAGLTIAFEQGDEVRVGELAAYRATTQKPGYLAIFDATPDGKLTQVYPNAASLRSPVSSSFESTRVEPGKPVVVPDYRNTYRGFNVRITEPRGEGLMVAVLSDKLLTSLDLPGAPKTFASLDAAREAIRRLRDELARNLEIKADAAGNPPWSVAMHKYTIR